VLRPGDVDIQTHNGEYTHRTLEPNFDFNRHLNMLAGTNSSSLRKEEEYKRNKENIPPFSSYSSSSSYV